MSLDRNVAIMYSCEPDEGYRRHARNMEWRLEWMDRDARDREAARERGIVLAAKMAAAEKRRAVTPGADKLAAWNGTNSTRELNLPRVRKARAVA